VGWRRSRESIVRANVRVDAIASLQCLFSGGKKDAGNIIPVATATVVETQPAASLLGKIDYATAPI
jgi:hypothetical protein